MARNTHETRFLLTAKDRTKSVFGSVNKGLQGVRKNVTGLHTGLLAVAGVLGGGLLVKGIVDTNAEFQTIKSSLATLTGGTKQAAAAFELIEDFAKSTPFDLQQVTQSFIKLKAMGLDPSESALRSYGNTASAMGKSMDQMIEAVADAATGEFERLKEFGIKARKQKDEVTFTFQGVEKTIKNTSENIQQYLLDIGNNKFGTAMSDQMKNLGPVFSNFGNAIDGVKRQIGEAGLNDAIAQITTEFTALIEALDPADIKLFVRETLGALADLMDGMNKVINVTDTLGNRLTFRRIQEIEEGGIGGGLPGYRLGDFNAQQPAVGSGIDAQSQTQRAADLREWQSQFIQAQNEQNPARESKEEDRHSQTFNETQKQTTLLQKTVEILERNAFGATAQ